MDTINIRLTVKTPDGLDASDPPVTIEIADVAEQNNAVVHATIPNLAESAMVKVPTPEQFPAWRVTATFSRYDAGAGFIFEPRGNPDPSHLFQVASLPEKWTPQFSLLAAIPSPRFDAFRQVVAQGASGDLKNGPPVRDLAANFDSMSGTSQILSRTRSRVVLASRLIATPLGPFEPAHL